MTRLWVIGDSWTDPGWGGWAWELGWPALVSRSLGLQLANSGVSGAGYCNGASNYPWQVARGAGVGSDVVVMWGSVNDTGWDPATTRVQSEATMRAAQLACPGGLLVVYGPQYWAASPPPALTATVEAVRASAAAVDADLFVDTSDWFREHPDLIDGSLHPSQAGQAFIAKRIEVDLLVALGSRRRPAYGADYSGGYTQPWQSPVAAAADVLLEDAP